MRPRGDIPPMNPVLKMSIGSIISNPIPDDEIMTSECNRKLKKIIISISADFIVTVILLTQECNFYKIDDSFESKNIFYFILGFFISLLILGIFITIFTIKSSIIAQICKFSYVIIGGIIYLVKTIIKFINLLDDNQIEDEDEEDEDLYGLEYSDIIFFFVHFLSIVPRIITFFFANSYIESLKKLENMKREAEHASFVEKLTNKIDRGYNRWSSLDNSFDVKDDNKKNNIEEYEDEKIMFSSDENSVAKDGSEEGHNKNGIND